jgi:hypothetical protein
LVVEARVQSGVEVDPPLVELLTSRKTVQLFSKQMVELEEVVGHPHKIAQQEEAVVLVEQVLMVVLVVSIAGNKPKELVELVQMDRLPQ